MPDSTEAIDDDELLLRRIPAMPAFYDPTVDPHPSPLAFRPNKNDATGLSVYRARYRTVESVAGGRPGKQYYVAVMRAGDLRANGIDVAPRPLEGDPGHAEIVGLTYENRKKLPYFEWQTLLAERLCQRIEGPYAGE